MAGFRISDGTDTDALYTAGNAGITTGFRNSAGTDLGNLYAAYVTGAKRAASGFRNSAGTDLSDLFQNSSVPIYTPMTLGKSGDAVGNCFDFIGEGCRATTNVVTISVSGGTPPYSYAWSYVSGAGAGINTPSSASTSFWRDGFSGGTFFTEYGVYRCTVTDATGPGANERTIDVNVTTTYSNGA